MTNSYGHPATPPPGYSRPARPRPSGATAIIAAVLALPLAGIAGYLPVDVFIDYGVDTLPGTLLTLLGCYLGAAVFLLIGALLTFFRVIAGAIMLLIGALLGLAAPLLEPALLGGNDYGTYFEAVFQLEFENAFVRLGAIVLAPVVLILAALPPTFRYLGHRPRPMPTYDPRPGYPAGGHPPRQW
ncbi:hypothetical protein [Amycolatopsis cihanbeyliensis]|uniref:Uncharacterized protein n=1 Tax=Amycolatopsis cihanbeyliensis TaxID=1128664 RepID=A0A542DHU1_AMYCI|nr:hypothetical protein [Amycolatopsis cihanbeyliensis]TQJ02649.1 hypothetical protein FB471_2384 [Amycolatopsis cihanbeyliensis]